MSRILVVEDQKVLRRAIRTLLEDLEHTVVIAPTADDGLKEALESRFDLIITDVFTPGSIDGLKLLVRVHSEAPRTKFILMSGSAIIDDPQTVEAARRVGVEHILPKPFSLDELSHAVHEVLGLPLRESPSVVEAAPSDEPVRLEPPPRPAMDASGAPREQDGKGPESIIVLEDNDALRAVIGKAIEAAGIEVFLCSDGTEVLDALAQSDAFDLLISDVFVPGMDGLELSMRVRHRYPDLAVMLMSGSAAFRAPGFRERANALGVRALLPKPFSSEEFWAAVTAAYTGSGYDELDGVESSDKSGARSDPDDA
jgi:CheY-like chemotaxis protein